MFYEEKGKIILRNEVSKLDIIQAIPNNIRNSVYEYVYLLVMSKAIAKSAMHESDKLDIIRKQMGDKAFNAARNYEDISFVIELCKKCIMSHDHLLLESYKAYLVKLTEEFVLLSSTDDMTKILDNIKRTKEQIKICTADIKASLNEGDYTPASPYLAENREFIIQCHNMES